MAIRNSDGQILIDEEAAERDVSELRKAGECLMEALTVVGQIRNGTDELHGKTAEAIRSQCDVFEKVMKELNDNMNEAARFIGRTVECYREADHAVRDQVNGMVETI